MSKIDVRRVKRLLSEMEEPIRVISESLLMNMNEFLLDIRSIYAVRHAIVMIVEIATLIGIHVLEAG